MSRRMKKLAGWRPYDFDTMMGINNEGSLAFSYDLEDFDVVSGADVYNGQQSVFWKLVRLAFADEIKAMYQDLRSTGAWSYSKFEQVFEAHQSKWPAALKNEDSWFKYLKPLLDPDAGDEPTTEYLAMCQGDKAEQRKWWLYNRFRYLDSKYNAGDALTDTVVLRAYAKANITVTPYASIYASVKYGSYLVQDRATRNQACTLVCPLDNVNDTETIIYSASQLADIGDLSGLKVGYASFVNATKINRIKLGDSDASYSNANLRTLYLGSNELLQILDVRNCPNLSGTIDASGCADLEEVYFDGTAITGVILPTGGMLKKLHLPSTVNNLDVRSQKKVTEFVMPSYSGIQTLRLENVSSAFNVDTIMAAMPSNSRVRLAGFSWEFNSCTAAQSGLYDVLNTFRGLDEQGSNTAKAQVVDSYIHVPSATGAEVAALKAQYPYIDVRADHLSATITYKTWDGETIIETETVYDGGDGTKTNSTARTSTTQYSYTANGWSLSADGTPDPDALKDVTEDRTVYAAYTATVRSYNITWVSDGTTLRTDTLEYGATPAWGQAMPTKDGQTATGWTPEIHAVIGTQTYTATYLPTYTATFVLAAADGGTTLYTQTNVPQGTTPTYSGSTPTSSRGNYFTFTGWTPALSGITANTTYTAEFVDNRSAVVQYLEGTLTAYESDENLTIAESAFYNHTALESVDLAAASGAVTIAANAFNGCTNLAHLVIRSSTKATLANVSAFTNTPISYGDGAVYVPSGLVASYKADSTWGNYLILPLSAYPATVFENVTETWAQIEANGGANLTLGDRKAASFNGTSYIFELVGKGKDTLKSGGTANTSWLMLPIKETHTMNSSATTTGGYAGSAMRTYINNTLLSTFELKDLVKEVVKVSDTYENSTIVHNGQTSDEKLWIPSAYEMFGGTDYETQGCTYSDFFTSYAKRIKYYNKSTINYWLRSVNSASGFRFVNNGGVVGNSSAYNANGVALGFCL